MATASQRATQIAAQKKALEAQIAKLAAELSSIESKAELEKKTIEAVDALLAKEGFKFEELFADRLGKGKPGKKSAGQAMKDDASKSSRDMTPKVYPYRTIDGTKGWMGPGAQGKAPAGIDKNNEKTYRKSTKAEIAADEKKRDDYLAKRAAKGSVDAPEVSGDD